MKTEDDEDGVVVRVWDLLFRASEERTTFGRNAKSGRNLLIYLTTAVVVNDRHR